MLEVRREQPGRRWFVVHSPERQEYERTQREGERERVSKGQLKQGGKIAAAAERLLQKHHGRRHFTVEAGPGKFAYRASARAAAADAGDGHYVLETTEAHLSAVEACFAQLKDGIELRAAWRPTAERVRGHVQVAALALLLQRMLDRRLREAGLDLLAHTALRVLQTVRVVEFEPVEGGRQRVVMKGSVLAQKVLKALKIRRKPPPRAPHEASETAKSSDVVIIRK